MTQKRQAPHHRAPGSCKFDRTFAPPDSAVTAFARNLVRGLMPLTVFGARLGSES